MTILLREELATLHRQVEQLGRSLQPNITPAPNNYRAPPTHTPGPNRTLPHSTTSSRSNDPGDDSSGYSKVKQQPNEQSDRFIDGKNKTARIIEHNNEHHIIDDSEAQKANEPTHEQNESDGQIITNKLEEEIEYQNNATVEQPVVVQDQHGDQNYSEDNYENYDQSYEHAPVETDYNQEYEQNQDQHGENYEQQNYAEPQYENYEQYPQQYTDPNAQYDTQYENYAEDGNLQEHMDHSQYNPEYSSEYQEVQPSETETLPPDSIHPENIHSEQSEFPTQSESKRNSPKKTEPNES
ncbi:unnamed protein product [Parnassius apollo]|uniref:(apollo) hypothetical protein n=1 Tax=Parnassius apollo TaxID=110799 RepID=A0A8S3YH18_PARAO|nr:unnamed protein product [Parnassius apollo]